MATRINSSTVVIGIFSAVIGGVLGMALTRGAASGSRPVRTSDGKPNFSGIWQANNEAYWDLQAHEARPGAVTQPGVYPNYEFARVAAAPVASSAWAEAAVAAVRTMGAALANQRRARIRELLIRGSGPSSQDLTCRVKGRDQLGPEQHFRGRRVYALLLGSCLECLEARNHPAYFRRKYISIANTAYFAGALCVAMARRARLFSPCWGLGAYPPPSSPAAAGSSCSLP